MPPSSHLAKLSSEEWRACTSWEYDTSFWQKTIIMDFDLVCDVRSDEIITANVTPTDIMISEIWPEEAAAASDLSRFDVWSLPQRADQ